ncbi:hypothetical protein CWI36_0334p0010 [Hamiltosporidium magnivora]|uniref:Uncharacterized protein n=1 Tax=Hamiltosporidium magnivora TaxID=148818 RepID=A0A4Q9LH24_9MICR|nr:hypothetical protein CWI36_0334p0010 [Hamiltosporidium magnivora]
MFQCRMKAIEWNQSDIKQQIDTFSLTMFTNNGVSANTFSHNQQALSERSQNQNCNIDNNQCNLNLELQNANRHNSSYFNLEFKYIFMLFL